MVTAPRPDDREITAFPLSPVIDERWTLRADGFELSREHEIESLFAVANGYLGVRGSLAEGSSLSRPATYLAGVFDDHDSALGPALLVLPGGVRLVVTTGEQALSLEEGTMLEHRRLLDLRQGILWRQWRHRDPAGRVTRMELLRLASLADRHVLAQSVRITPENHAGRIRVEAPVEDWRTPPSGRVGKRSGGNGVTLIIEAPRATVALGTTSAFRTSEESDVEWSVESGPSEAVERWTWDADLGATLRLDRLVAFYSSRERQDPEAAVAETLAGLEPGGVTEVVHAHVQAWDRRWHVADVRVAGDDEVQLALRFAVYHLVSAGNPDDGRVSIGARALTGPAYRGHVFWDTEIYALPFYVFTDPPTARALLMYRFHTLPAARDKAVRLGYRGALYAWESADTGEETTPTELLGPDGRVMPVMTGEQEQHISADVAYAVWQYWMATADDAFMLDAGAEILFETARFWASRAVLEADGRHHIRGVIGPDEYHEQVDDNAYTNLMARWNLERAADTATLLVDRWPERWRQLATRLALDLGDCQQWRRLAANMERGFRAEKGLFEQFDGFFELDDVDLAAHAACATPIDVCLGRERTQRSQVLKQADVVALSALLWDDFPRAIHEANFRYYEPRTAHGSSLSPALHALVAARLGDVTLARRYFHQAAEIDLANNMGNAAGGVHIAALGGLWQAAVLGFGGMRLRAAGLAFDPRLPTGWQALTFRVQWRGRTVSVEISQEPRRLAVEVEGPGPMMLSIVNGPDQWAIPGRRYAVMFDGGHWGDWQEIG